VKGVHILTSRERDEKYVHYSPLWCRRDIILPRQNVEFCDGLPPDLKMFTNPKFSYVLADLCKWLKEHCHNEMPQ
jgi:hypothetical protein